MIQPTLMPFSKKKVQNRWTEDELSNLLRTIEQIEPVDSRGWQKVTEKMQELGPKRQTKSYKEKFTNYLNKKESLQVRQVEKINKNILKQFNEGKSPQQISKLINISVFLVKKMLKSILIKTQKYIPRIIGKRMEKKISINDYDFFTYIQQNNLELISLSKVEYLSLHWNALKDSKNDYKTNNPKLYQKTLEYIKKKIIQFNTNLNLYSIYFAEHLACNKESQQQQKRSNKDRNEMEYSSLFLASSHLIKLEDDMSEEDSIISIQVRFEEPSLQEIKPYNLKADSIPKCLSLNNQTNNDKSDYYKLSDFKLKRPPIQNFLPTSDNFPDYTDIPPSQPLTQKFSSFEFTIQNDECFFSQADYSYMEKYF